MNTYSQIKSKYSKQEMMINGSLFPYRYYKNENSDKTIVLLTGGIGLSDLMLFHFDEFAKSYSVLSFDYTIAYSTNKELVDAIAQLLCKLNIKAFLVGQSLGGFIAQMLAQQYPEVVEGLILSNTGTLSVDLDDEGSKCFYDMMKRIDKSLILIKMMPFNFMKKNIKKSVMKKTGQQLSPKEQVLMEELCDEMVKTLTKDYEIHMTLLLKDLLKYCNMKANNFTRFKGKVLLILSDDDDTFNDSVKQTLINIMPNPPVITDIRGGHLALLLKMDKYIQCITDFISHVD